MNGEMISVTISFGAPQIIMICLYAFDLIYTAVHHGDSKVDEKYNVWITIIGITISAALLTWGGFF